MPRNIFRNDPKTYYLIRKSLRFDRSKIVLAELGRTSKGFRGVHGKMEEEYGERIGQQ